MNAEERLLELLSTRATQGLSIEQTRELEGALRTASGVDPDGLDLAAAATDLAFLAAAPALEPMPEELKQRILSRSRQQVSRERRHPEPASVTPFPRPENPKPGPLAPRYLGWYVAAAMLLLALWSPWSTQLEPPPEPPVPTLAEQRSRLMGGVQDLIQVSWARPAIAEYAQVEGDVVWSNERQAGFMRLRGLPANRTEVEQYQLWIVDPSRDANPIDGGVFDIPAGVDEVIVPIDAKLRANAPTAFAITLEQPGGVVVSDGPLLVVAAVES